MRDITLRARIWEVEKVKRKNRHIGSGMPRSIGCFVALTLLVIVCLATPTGDVLVFSYRIEVRLENGSTRPWNMSEVMPSLALFLNTSWQRATVVNTSQPIEDVISDADGNPRLLLRAANTVLGPGESLALAAEYKIASEPRSPPNIDTGCAGHLYDIPEPLVSELCREAGCWTVGFEPLRELAFELARGRTNVLEILASFIMWIHENITYHPFETPLYPNETFLSGLGAHDDQVNLLITLCRIVGIPAYLQVGYVFTPYHRDEFVLGAGHLRWELVNMRWHAWAVVYVPPWGWLPVDLTAIGGLVVDPLDAIRRALVWDQNTLLLAEVRCTDYVATARQALEFLREHGLYVHREERLELLAEEQDILSELWPYIAASSAMVPISLAIILVALKLRKKRSARRGSEATG